MKNVSSQDAALPRQKKPLYRSQIDGALYYERRRTMREQQQVLERAGLTREAQALTPKINALTADIQRCARQAMHEHEQCVIATHLALVACDLLTLVADRVADIFEANSAMGRNDATVKVVDNIRTIADDFNQVVQAIDMLPGNAGMVYADMSEFAIQGILDTMLNRINEYLNKPGTNAIK
jgi:uncharacterized protein YoxC